jgi:transcriptional regulator with XRE-family HTH domain
MPFKEVDLEKLADKLGINYVDVLAKQKLITNIAKMRREMHLSQAALAKRVGVTQSRIAQIESGIGTSRVSFDVLFNIIHALGFDFQIRLKKVA